MVVETSQFKTRPGVSDEELLAASQAAQDAYLSKCRGFVGRELLRGDDGTWLDIVRFETMEDAQAAMRDFIGQASTKAFEEAIDPATATMRHYELVTAY